MSKKSIYEVISGQTVVFTDKAKKIIVTQDAGKPNFPVKVHRESAADSNYYDYIGLKFIPNDIVSDKDSGHKLLAYVKDFIENKN